jgi:hypothetical protein
LQDIAAAALDAGADEASLAALGFDFSWAIDDVPAAGARPAAPADLSQAAEELVPLSRQSIEARPLHPAPHHHTPQSTGPCRLRRTTTTCWR